MPPFLLVEQRDHVVTLTMNEPERRNPLTGNAAVPEFLAELARIQADRNVRVVILTGAGPAFSAGGDVRKMAEQAGPAVEPLALRQFYRSGIQQLALAMVDLEVPLIAAVNGPAIGAGLDLACMCDLRIASENARFAESFVKLGLIPGDGGAWLLPRVVGWSRAAELSFTGDAIDARQALEWGLVSRVVPADALMDAARELAARIAVNPPDAVRLTKRLMREGQHARLAGVLELSAAFQAIAHKTADHEQAVRAFIARRAPR